MSTISAEESATLTDPSVMGEPVYRLKHTWTVKDFAATFLADSADKETNLYSGWFSASLDCQTTFRIVVRPRDRNNLSLYLEMKRSGPSHKSAKSVDVKYKISLLNERKEEFHSREFRREFEYPRDVYGWSTFLKQTELQDPANGLLPSDTLTILAEIDVFPEPVTHLGQDLLMAILKAASIETVRALHTNLLVSGEQSDVVLVVEGSDIPAHKNILSAVSPFFRDKFNSKMTEENDGKVIIPEMKKDVAYELLRFIYKGEVENLEKYAEELLVAADKCQVAHLKALCNQHLCGLVNKPNAARLFDFAQRHSVEMLKNVCIEYICANWKEVMMLTADWKPVHDQFIEELRKMKLKEEETRKGEKSKTPEESESFK